MTMTIENPVEYRGAAELAAWCREQARLNRLATRDPGPDLSREYAVELDRLVADAERFEAIAALLTVLSPRERDHTP